MPLPINFWYQILRNQMVFKKIFFPKIILTRHSDMSAKKDSAHTTPPNSSWSARPPSTSPANRMCHCPRQGSTSSLWQRQGPPVAASEETTGCPPLKRRRGVHETARRHPSMGSGAARLGPRTRFTQHTDPAAHRDFTPTRTTMRTIMMTNNIKITSIFRFFF